MHRDLELIAAPRPARLRRGVDRRAPLERVRDDRLARGVHRRRRRAHDARSSSAPGVSSLPYHHPLILADRILMLDHLTQGPDDVRRRARPAGVGRGDARHRRRRAAADDGGELRRHHGAVPWRGRRRRRPTGSRSTRAACSCGRTRTFDIAVAASISPSGPKLAGRHGVGLLSVAATNPAGFENLAGHWKVMEEQAAEARRDRRPRRSGG